MTGEKPELYNPICLDKNNRWADCWKEAICLQKDLRYFYNENSAKGKREEWSAQREHRELSTQAVYWQRKQINHELSAKKENIQLEEPQVDALGRSGRLVANSK